jgi:hypothetical protein
MSTYVGDNGYIEPCASDGTHTCHNSSYNGSSDALIVTPRMTDPGSQLQSLLNYISTDLCNSTAGPLWYLLDDNLLESARRALSSPAIDGHNAGFMRDFAMLSLIFVNGDMEDDHSPYETWVDYLAFIQSLKPHPWLVTVNYIVTQDPKLTDRYPDLDYMVQAAGGVLVVGLQWETEMARLWQTVLGAENIYPLSARPDPSSIKVYLDGPPPDQVQSGEAPGALLKSADPNGTINWSYDPAANTVVINPASVSLGNGDSLYVEYTLLCG